MTQDNNQVSERDLSNPENTAVSSSAKPVDAGGKASIDAVKSSFSSWKGQVQTQGELKSARTALENAKSKLASDEADYELRTNILSSYDAMVAAEQGKIDLAESVIAQVKDEESSADQMLEQLRDEMAVLKAQHEDVMERAALMLEDAQTEKIQATINRVQTAAETHDAKKAANARTKTAWQRSASPDPTDNFIIAASSGHKVKKAAKQASKEAKAASKEAKEEVKNVKAVIKELKEEHKSEEAELQSRINALEEQYQSAKKQRIDAEHDIEEARANLEKYAQIKEHPEETEQLARDIDAQKLAIQEQEAEVARLQQETENLKGEAAKSKKALIIAVAAIVLVIIAGVVIFNAVQESQRQAAVAQIEAIDGSRLAADAESTILAGVASSDFVDEDPYVLDSLTIESRDVNGDAMTIAGTISKHNKFFEETGPVQALYRKQSDGTWAPESILVDQGKIVVTPTRGISHDEERGLKDIDPKLTKTSAGNYACRYKEDVKMNSWLGAVSYVMDNNYVFTNNRWSWMMDSTNKISGYADKLAGTYTVTFKENKSDSEDAKLTVKISNVNEKDSRCQIEYAYEGGKEGLDKKGEAEARVSVSSKGNLQIEALNRSGFEMTCEVTSKTDPVLDVTKCAIDQVDRTKNSDPKLVQLKKEQ